MRFNVALRMGAQPRLSSTGRALVGGRTGAARACFQSAACCCAAGWQPFVDAVYARISPSIFIQAWDCDCARRDGPLARRGLVCFSRKHTPLFARLERRRRGALQRFFRPRAHLCPKKSAAVRLASLAPGRVVLVLLAGAAPRAAYCAPIVGYSAATGADRSADSADKPAVSAAFARLVHTRGLWPADAQARRDECDGLVCDSQLYRTVCFCLDGLACGANRLSAAACTESGPSCAGFSSAFQCIGMRDCPMRNRLLDAACTLAPGLPSQSALAQRCPVQRGHNVDVGIADDLMAAICQLRTHIPGGCGAHLSAFARRLSLHPASAAR